MTSKLPKEWTIARLRAIPKQSSSSAHNNLRTIIILLCLSKITEHFMKEQLDSFLNISNAMHYAHFGFRPERYTSKLLISVTESIRNNVSVVRRYVFVALDLTKVFDRVACSKFINQLYDKFNFSGSLCKLIWSYISNRKHFVYVNDSNTSCTETMCDGGYTRFHFGPAAISSIHKWVWGFDW